MRKIGTPRVFASIKNCAATSRICEIDPGTEQDQSSRNDSAPEDAIEFRYARRNAYVVLRFNLRVSDGLRLLQTKAVAIAAFLRSDDALFNQRIPLAAFGALAQPLARLIAAALADADGGLAVAHLTDYGLCRL